MHLQMRPSLPVTLFQPAKDQKSKIADVEKQKTRKKNVDEMMGSFVLNRKKLVISDKNRHQKHINV